MPETYDRWPGEPGAAPGAYDRSRERWEPWWPEGPEEPGWGAACGSRGHGWRLRGLTWGRGGLRATIDRGDARVTVTFDDVNSVVSARWSGTADRGASLARRARCLGEAAARGPLFELRDSEFQDWAVRESFVRWYIYAHDRMVPRHLCLVCDYCVDVLFLEEPRVEVSGVPATGPGRGDALPAAAGVGEGRPAAPGAYDRSRERWAPWWPEGSEMPDMGDVHGLLDYKYWLRGLSWGADGLGVVLDCEEGDVRVTVTFGDVGSVAAVRWSGAGDRDGSLGYKGRSLGALEGAGRPTWGLLYELRDSEFQDWAAREGAAHGRGARHLCLVCDDDYVDVLFLEEPGVEVSAIPPSEADGW